MDWAIALRTAVVKDCMMYIQAGIVADSVPDNERGKGDHRHTGDTEQPYTFTDETQLLEDFWQDVKEATK